MIRKNARIYQTDFFCRSWSENLSVSMKATSIYFGNIDDQKQKIKVERVTLLLAYFNCPFLGARYTHSSPKRPECYLNFFVPFCMKNKKWSNTKYIYQPHTAMYRRRFGWMFFDHPHIVVIDRLLCIQLLYCVTLPIFKHFELLLAFFSLSFTRSIGSVTTIARRNNKQNGQRPCGWQNAIKMLYRISNLMHFNLEQMHIDFTAN